MIRPLRGRVVIREDKRLSSLIHHPDVNPRDEKTHRGEVIALGEPFMLPSGAEIPWPFRVGDTVQFHYEATEKGRTITWGDAGKCVVMAAREVDAVWEDTSRWHKDDLSGRLSDRRGFEHIDDIQEAEYVPAPVSPEVEERINAAYQRGHQPVARFGTRVK